MADKSGPKPNAKQSDETPPDTKDERLFLVFKTDEDYLIENGDFDGADGG